MPARIVLISGCPGSGKTTVSRILAENSIYEKAVHIEVDDFWQYIRKGYINPWENDSGDQNEAVVQAVAASAKIYAKSGYETFIAGTIGPWFLKPWLKIVRKDVDVRYVVLRPDEETTVLRAAERRQREFFPLNTDIVKDLWHSFTDLGVYESNVIDTTGQTAEESAAVIQKMLAENAFRIF